MMKVFLFISILFSNFCFSQEDWKFYLGSKELFFDVLNRNVGLRNIYNCKLLIEKVKNENKNILFLTMDDYISGKIGVVSFKRKIEEHIKPMDNINEIQVFKELDGRFLIKLVLKTNYKGQIEYISYFEYDSFTGSYNNNIKCSKFGK